MNDHKTNCKFKLSRIDSIKPIDQRHSDQHRSDIPSRLDQAEQDSLGRFGEIDQPTLSDFATSSADKDDYLTSLTQNRTMAWTPAATNRSKPLLSWSVATRVQWVALITDGRFSYGRIGLVQLDVEVAELDRYRLITQG